jgi:hypothetical protein
MVTRSSLAFVGVGGAVVRQDGLRAFAPRRRHVELGLPGLADRRGEAAKPAAAGAGRARKEVLDATG